MAAGGVFTQYRAATSTIDTEDDFNILSDRKFEQLIDPTKVDPSVQALAKTLNELSLRVFTVSKQFEDHMNIAETSKGMFYQSWGYRPFSNLARMATQWYLTPEQHEAMFGQTAIHKASSDLLSAVFLKSMENLKDGVTPDDFHLSLRNLRVALNDLIPLYLSAMEKADVLQREFQALPEGLQEKLDEYLEKNGMPTIGGHKGVGNAGTQHVARIPMVLKTLADAAEENEHVGIQVEGRLIRDILNEKIAPAMLRKYSSRS